MSDQNKSRRGALGLFAGAGALAIAPTVAIAATNEPDPIFAAIAAHKSIFAWASESDTTEEETDRRVVLEDEAFWSLAQTEPTTIRGVITLLEYVAAYDNGCFLTAEVPHACMETVANALRKIGELANVCHSRAPAS